MKQEKEINLAYKGNPYGLKVEKEFNLSEKIDEFKKDLRYALGKFNWANSCLDAQAITILNEWSKRLDEIEEEFIKIILEEINEEWDGKGKCPTTEEIIKKRAGEKLVG